LKIRSITIFIILIIILLEVVNFNHKLRKEADIEAAFIENITKMYGLRYYQRDIPHDLISSSSSSSIQEISRNWRRSECLKILKTISSSSSSDKVIATAHHADDQLETFMMKFLRGVHISNLYPMIPRNGSFIIIKSYFKHYE
jgi:tRNA(Ile)-lysidine synthase